jgi:Flp pilus assembly CpaE family ATPase
MDLAGGLAFRLDLDAVPSWSTFAPGAAATLAPDAGEFDPDAGRFALAAGTGQEAGAFEPDAGPAALDPDVFIRTLAEPCPGLSVLPLAGPADGAPESPPAPSVVQHVLEVARTSHRVVVADLPAADGPTVGAALSQADALVAVARCETAGVRGLQTALDAWTAAGHDPDSAGAAVTGVRPRAPLAPREVRTALGDRLWSLVPAAAAELAAAAEDGVLLLDRHDLPAVQAMVTLANRVVPFAAVSA